MNKLKLITLFDCESCKIIKDLLNEKQIEFDEVNFYKDFDAQVTMFEKGIKDVPQLFVKNKLIIRGGYNTIKTMTRDEIIDRINCA